MSRTDYFHDPDAPVPNSIKVAMSALVQDEHGRILMIRRTDNDKYSIPGGGLEAGETVAQAVAREVMEETGIEVDATELIGVFSNPDHVIAYDDGEVRQEFSLCFRANPIGGTPQTSSESKEVRWVDPADSARSTSTHRSVSASARDSKLRVSPTSLEQPPPRCVAGPRGGLDQVRRSLGDRVRDNMAWSVPGLDLSDPQRWLCPRVGVIVMPAHQSASRKGVRSSAHSISIARRRASTWAAE